MEEHTEDTTTRTNTNTNQHQHQRQRHRRRRRTLSNTTNNANVSANGGDDPWWWEIENENLILDHVPNVTAVFSESESNVLSDDFNSLLKIGDNVNLTLSDTNNASEAAATTTTATSEVLEDLFLTKTDYQATTTSSASSATHATAREVSPIQNTREQSLEEFKAELHVKRLARQTAVQDLRDEITLLRQQLATEQALTCRLRSGEECTRDKTNAKNNNYSLDACVGATSQIVCNNAVDANADADADDVDPMSRGRHANIELANAQLALQMANSENLSLRTELGVTQKQVGTLKEVIACCKQMLAVKEEHCTQLKAKLTEIENTFGERELKIMSTNLRQEYERQLGNMRQLRELYEERQRVAAAEHENLQRLISIKKDELLAEQEKTKNFEERNQTLMKEVETANNELVSVREECNEHKFEKKALKEEMGAVNTLFSQMVMGFNGKNNVDIDRLVTMLEENRTLLNDMATKEINCSDGATLPKLLFELVEQASVSNNSTSRSPTPTAYTDTASEDEGELQQQQQATSTIVCVEDVDISSNNAKGVANEVIRNIENTITNVSAAATQEGEQQQQSVEDDAAVGATAICYNITTDKDNAIDSNTMRNTKKHHRKNASGKMKMLSSNSDTTTTTSSTLKFYEPEVIGKVASTEEIIGNLPKVWKVLMELLSHHKIEQVQFAENGKSEDCYKSVETPNGPKAELSVSKTYIKLKDLILEKKSLVKETNRLKTLNNHLDYRLNEQEKRLSAVSLELTKTWHLVGKMQRQHRQLHTQEQILRYQLQQKRRLLSELKEELEYCRRKWAAARAKNDESQEQCNDLRREFAKRKLEDAHHSAESGYSDSGPPSDEDERERSGASAVAVVAAVVGGNSASASGSSAVGGSCRRKILKEKFEHTRKIKRMQSTSPGRAGYGGDEIVLRWNSAPPTCGWRGEDDDEEEEDDNDEGGGDCDYVDEEGATAATHRGAVPKCETRSSRSKARVRREDLKDDIGCDDVTITDNNGREQRSVRIHRLEEQCKSLIQQVLETSDDRERLEVQLCQFQDEIAPVQYAVPLKDLISKKRIDRMMRASSAPATGTLTPREEEYTRKRSERLGRLEEESRQLMSRIKRTSDRGHYLRCSLDRIRRAPSREGSFDSNTEDESNKTELSSSDELPKKTDAIEKPQPLTVLQEKAVEDDDPNKNPLTANEEEYTARRAARLQRLEDESKELLTKLSHNTQRGDNLVSKLDGLHERYDNAQITQSTRYAPKSIGERIEDIDKISANREERLRILEEEGNELISRLSSTSERGTQMINRIAEREQSRQERSSLKNNEDKETEKAKLKDSTVLCDEIPVAETLLPPLKNVACTSIVDEELAECVTVTTTTSRIAEQQGAIPKSKPVAQLSAGRTRTSSKNQALIKEDESDNVESLEQMVQRLQSLPFPNEKDINKDDNKEKVAQVKEEYNETLQFSEENGKHETCEKKSDSELLDNTQENIEAENEVPQETQSETAHKE